MLSGLLSSLLDRHARAQLRLAASGQIALQFFPSFLISFSLLVLAHDGVRGQRLLEKMIDLYLIDFCH